MKIFVSHSYGFDYEEELYKPIKESLLNKNNVFFLPHESGESINTKDEINKSDLLIAEVSYPATGQGIELGWANIANVSIVCVSKNGSRISNSLKYITNDFISYSDSDDLIKKITLFLNNH